VPASAGTFDARALLVAWLGLRPLQVGPTLARADRAHEIRGRQAEAA
jgi:hypothetical protein